MKNKKSSIKKTPNQGLKKIKKNKPKSDKENIRQIKIKVIGIGGGGCSIVSEISNRLKKPDFIIANTDLQALEKNCRQCRQFQFGAELTNGLGCGMNPELGKKAAEQEKEKIKKLLEGADFCILASCLGGGTGTGASPIFAEIIKEMKIISFGIFTLPFKFEGEKKTKIALQALEKIKPNLNALSIIPNEKIFQIIDKNTTLEKALSSLNKILEQGMEGLIEMIYSPGLINIDWADIKTILEGNGKICYLNSIEEKKERKQDELVRAILKNPLQEYNIQDAERILYNIASDKQLKMKDVEQISNGITNFSSKAKIIFGISYNPKYHGKIRITLLATGYEKSKQKPKIQTKKQIIKKDLIINKTETKKEIKENINKKNEIKKSSDNQKSDKSKQQTENKSEKQSSKIPESEPRRNNLKSKKEKTQTIKKTEFPILLSKNISKRKTALEIKKEMEKAEKEILEQEKKWEIPAFLRRKKI